MASHDDTPSDGSLGNGGMAAEETELQRLLTRIAMMIVDQTDGNETALRCRADEICAALSSHVVREYHRRGVEEMDR